MKISFQLTLTGLDAQLLESATTIACHHSKGDEPYNQTRRWFVQWAVRAVARAVIAAKQMPRPLAVQMRMEFQEETAARVALIKADALAIEDTPSNQLAVLCEALHQRANELGAIVDSRAESKLGFVPVGSRWN